MNFEIPILVQQATHKGQSTFSLRSVFLPQLHVRRDRLASALSRMSQDVRKLVHSVRGTKAETELLTRLSFNPDIKATRLKLKLELRNDIVDVVCCVASFAHLGRRQAFLPADRSLWLEFTDEERAADRVSELLTDHLRRVEKEDGPDAVKSRVSALKVEGTPWLTHLRLNISTKIRRKKDDDERRLSFFGQSDDFL